PQSPTPSSRLFTRTSERRAPVEPKTLPARVTSPVGNLSPPLTHSAKITPGKVDRSRINSRGLFSAEYGIGAFERNGERGGLFAFRME
ncbi:MAG: hypothetical protein AABY90_03915, partial [Nitrospirota bacterium]